MGRDQIDIVNEELNKFFDREYYWETKRGAVDVGGMDGGDETGY